MWVQVPFIAYGHVSSLVLSLWHCYGFHQNKEHKRVLQVRQCGAFLWNVVLGQNSLCRSTLHCHIWLCNFIILEHFFKKPILLGWWVEQIVSHNNILSPHHFSICYGLIYHKTWHQQLWFFCNCTIVDVKFKVNWVIGGNHDMCLP